MSRNLKDYKQGQTVTLQHKTATIKVVGEIHMEFDDDLGRLEVLDRSDNSVHIVQEDDKFWEITA
jgi:ribosomal protein L21E